MKPSEEQKAVFWCSLLHEILFEEIDEKEVYSYLCSLAKKEVMFPNGVKKKPSLATLKRKLAIYRDHGFDGLKRKGRSDRGKPRKYTCDIIDKAVEIKRDQPKRSAATVNVFLKEHRDTTIPRSTLYRYLKCHGATRFKLGVTKAKVRCRWTRDFPNELWVGDFQEGPYVLVGGDVVPTSLSLFIDCHSRFVVEGRYYLRKSIDILIDSLLRAFTLHGIPENLYLDNAKVYHSHALKAACYAMRIHLIHRTPRDPSPGGLVERLFETNQSQFESEVRAGEILTLEKLNQAFLAWLTVVYHETIHSEFKQTPRMLYTQGQNKSRPVDIDQIILFFMSKETRTVNKDFSDVSIQNSFYRVDPKLRGDRVIVRYDPFGAMDKVLLYSKENRFLGTGLLHQREKTNQTFEATPLPKPKHNYVDLIISKHQKQITAQVQSIDYCKLVSSSIWPFSAFVQTLAQLMGKKGGTSAFSADELETLKRIYAKYPSLTPMRLQNAFEQADITTVGQLAFSLQHLTQE